MMESEMKRLTDAQKSYVVQELACFGTPKEVSEALMLEHGARLAASDCSERSRIDTAPPRSHVLPS
jgi:hypothetical protein